MYSFCHTQECPHGKTSIVVTVNEGSVKIQYTSHWPVEGLYEMICEGNTIYSTPVFMIFNINKIQMHIKPEEKEEENDDSSISSNDSLYVFEEEFSHVFYDINNYYWELLLTNQDIPSDDSLKLSPFSQTENAKYNTIFNSILLFNNNLSPDHGGLDPKISNVVEKLDKVKMQKM